MPRHRNRRPQIEAERDARRKADRERIERAARALLTSDGWQRWIRVRATNGLSRYSLRNQWLIACECHARGITPTYVAGFRAFLALNRCVRKGETAIRILAPVAVKQRDDTGEETGEKRIFFRTVPVFDTLSRVRCVGHRFCGGTVGCRGVEQRGRSLPRRGAGEEPRSGDDPVPRRARLRGRGPAATQTRGSGGSLSCAAACSGAWWTSAAAR
jgi:N-terminal domain of anti-restriction factor ArdC